MKRKTLKNKKRIVIKIGSASLTHHETGLLNLDKMERLVRILTNLRNHGRDVILVSSGAIAVGRNALGFVENQRNIYKTSLCSGRRARLMMVYQKLFSSITDGSSNPHDKRHHAK